MSEGEESGDMKERNVSSNGVSHLSSTVSQNNKDGAEKGDPVTERYTFAQWITLVTFAFANFCIGACLSLQAPFFPREAEAKGASPTEYGLIFGAYQLTVFITSPVIGKLLPYLAPKTVLNFGILTIGVSSVLFGTLDSLPNGVPFVALAFVVRIVEGFGAAALNTAMYTMIAAEFKKKMTTTFGLLETFSGIGMILGPTLGGALYDCGGYGLPFFVTGGLEILDAVIICVALPKPVKCEHEKKTNLLKFWFNPGILIYSLTVFTSFNYIGFCAAALEPHVRSLHLSGVLLGLVFAIGGTVYATSAMFWGWLGDKNVGYKLLIFIGCCLAVSSTALIGPMPFFKTEPRLGFTIAALVLMGLAMGAKLVSAFGGSVEDTVARGFPPDITTYGLVSSMFASSQSLGAFVGPSLGGYLLEVVKFRMATVVLLGLEMFLMVVLSIHVCVNRCHGSSHTDREKRPLISCNLELQTNNF